MRDERNPCGNFDKYLPVRPHFTTSVDLTPVLIFFL
jgi:hypothetical protein